MNPNYKTSIRKTLKKTEYLESLQEKYELNNSLGNLKKLIDMSVIKKKSCVSNGDDYQILFTASRSKSRIIYNVGKSLGIKISKIGKICARKANPQIYDEKNRKISLKSDGYYHKF